VRTIDELARVYSLPNCPKCEELKEWLERQGIEFEARRFDSEAQTEFIMRNIFGNPPILEKGNVAKPSEELFVEEELVEDSVLEVLSVGKN
jgi:glutaredoxin